MGDESLSEMLSIARNYRHANWNWRKRYFTKVTPIFTARERIRAFEKKAIAYILIIKWAGLNKDTRNCDSTYTSWTKKVPCNTEWWWGSGFSKTIALLHQVPTIVEHSLSWDGTKSRRWPILFSWLHVLSWPANDPLINHLEDIFVGLSNQSDEFGWEGNCNSIDQQGRNILMCTISA